MLISHEVPIDILPLSTTFNDYDYCLLHLTYESESYKKFYSHSKRKVLLDNSLFELGDALSNDKLAQGVIDLRPTWFVVPDCLNSEKITCERFEAFMQTYKSLGSKVIGVAQGSTLEELVRCYDYMSEHADKIAIPFDSAAFDDLGDEIDNLERWCLGRQRFIELLVSEGLWRSDKPHHLLGCSYAKEFKNPLYKKISIESCDTSNPVVAGIQGLRYIPDVGLSTKPATKLCDLINHQCSETDIQNIKFNVDQFRRICNYES